jgi:hypothetical protein
MWNCAKCGEAIEGREYEFCWSCGSPKPIHTPAGASTFGGESRLSHTQLEASPGLRLISYPACDSQISSHAASCPRCGHPQKSELAAPGVATHRDFLEEVIYPYKCAGHHVTQQTEYAITMVKPEKRLSVGLAVLLYIFLWPAGVAYTLSRWNSRDKPACFRVLPSGQMEVSGDLLGAGGGRSSSGAWVLLTCAGVILALMAILMLVRFK